MKKRAVLVILLYLALCAVITVNVYFPEKELKEAYQDLKSLAIPRVEWVSTALAQNTAPAGNTSATVKDMPEVAQIDRMKDTGAVGEGNKGLLVIRNEKQITASDRALIKAENANRTKMINGMAREIVRFNKVPENEKNIAKVRPKAARQFADVRRDNARPGWWVQSPSGAWTKK